MVGLWSQLLCFSRSSAPLRGCRPSKQVRARSDRQQTATRGRSRHETVARPCSTGMHNFHIRHNKHKANALGRAHLYSNTPTVCTPYHSRVHSVCLMLQDWVPVITRDSATQDREVIQRSAQTRPLSDAYISSMPAKRRRVRTAMQPRSSLFMYCLWE